MGWGALGAVGSPGAPGVLSRPAIAWTVVLAGLAAITAWVLLQPAPLALGGDNETLHHPLFVDVLRQLRAGVLPIWTTGRWGGSPLIGDPVLGATYPPNYLGYLIGSRDRAIDVAACVHLIVFATGMLWCLGRVGVRPWIAVVGVTLAVLNPAFVYVARSWINWWGAISWWPWLLGASLEVARDGRRVGLAAVALAAQVYAGYPQYALHSGLLALAMIVVASSRSWRSRLVDAVLVVGGAIGLAAPQLVPGLAMAAESMRLGPGGTQRLVALDIAAIGPSAWLDVVRSTPSLGASPCKLALVVFALALVGALDRRASVRLLAVVAVAAAIAASGPSWLVDVMHRLPLFGFFAGPFKFFYLFAFVSHVLAALGLERMARRTPALGATAAGLALVLGAAFFARTTPLTTPQPFSRDAFTPLLKESPVGVTDTPRERWIALDEADGAVRQTGMNFGALWGIASVSGVGPLPPWRAFEVLGNAEAGSGPALVSHLGVSRVVVRTGTPLETSLLGSGLQRVRSLDRLSILAVPSPTPGAVLASEALFVDAARDVADARRGSGLTTAPVLVEATPVGTKDDGDPQGRIELVQESTGSHHWKVDVARPTWLVVREPFYRGWTASVDARPVDLRPAGGFFVALRVDAGRHDVTLRYREPGLVPGMIVWLVAAIVLLAVGERTRSYVPATAPAT